MPNSTRPQVIQLEKIILDAGTQQRARLDDAVVSDFADSIKSKQELPPVDIFSDGKSYWLADGFHRVEAARRAGQKTVHINLHKGTHRDAILFSCKANHHHGLRRTNDDKRKCVATILADAEWSQEWSDGVIAEVCGVSQNFVRSLRPQLSTELSSTPAKRIGKDGKARPVNRKASAKKPTADQRAMAAAIHIASSASETACPNCGATEFDEDGDCAKCHEPGVIAVQKARPIVPFRPAPKRRERKAKPFDAEATFRFAEMGCEEYIWAHRWPVEYRQKLSDLFTRLAEMALTYDPEKDPESPWFKPAAEVDA